MEEYKIDENTTYIDDGNSKIIKYAKQDGSSLVVKFSSKYPDDADYTFVNAEIYTEKPIKGEEKQTEEKKLSKFEKAKNKLLSKILAKKSNFSKEVLFNDNFINVDFYLSDFLTKPIRLEPEYKSINKVLESARKTIITDGYRLRREAEKVYLEQQKAEYAKEDKAASAKRSALDNDVARKLKYFGR